MSRNDWSRIEVEAVVADYLDMLMKETAGVRYSKAAHRRALLPKLNGRSEPSVEFKRRNISSALRELRHPWIEGYLPAANRQQLLFEVVSERVTADAALETALERAVQLPATSIRVSNILEREEPPPKREKLAGSSTDPPRRQRATCVPKDYVALEAANHSLGNAGELFVLDFERARLRQLGKDALADRVEHVAVTLGDGEGFDVRSFERSGKDRLIEVKTTAHAAGTFFYVSRNELAVSRARRDLYHLYRVFRFRRDPRLFQLHGALDEVCRLEPAVYLGRAG